MSVFVAANSLVVIDATRRIDPGNGLIVVDLNKPVALA